LIVAIQSCNSKWYCFNWALIAAAIKSFVVINFLIAAVAVSFVTGTVNYVSQLVPLNNFADYWRSVEKVYKIYHCYELLIY
jgi:hypothetical protein